MSTGGGGRAGSSIAFSVGPGAIPADSTRLALLRATVSAAVAMGIRHFDLSESTSPDAAAAVTRVAAGPRWPELTVFVPDRPDSPSLRPSGENASFVRLRPAASAAVAVDPGDRPAEGLRFPDLASAEGFAGLGVQDGAKWISFPGSMIEARRVRDVADSVQTAGGRVLVTNPHADGRLGGAGEGFPSTGGTAAPTPLAALERAYAPVLRLGFLTAHGRRTLPQAAVAFLVAVGATPSVRFSDVRQLAAFGDAPRIAPLDPEELARLLQSP